MTFGKTVIAAAARFPDPDAPQKVHEFDSPDLLAEILDRLLERSGRFDFIEDLPRQLHEASESLSGDVRVAEAARGVKRLAEGFENFLQLIASEKFGHDGELLVGNAQHVGFFNTSLGGLLVGKPSAKRGLSPKETEEIPKARIVQFDFGSNDIASRVFERTRQIRNDVHAARNEDVFSVIRKAQVVFGAYLFATDQNLPTLVRTLDPSREYLQQIVRQPLPGVGFVIEPALHADQQLPVAVSAGRVPLQSLLQGILAAQGPWTLAVLGDPGAGKTTMLAELARRVADKHLRDPLGCPLVPIVISANRYTGKATFENLLLGEIQSFAESQVPLLICVDGLNEVPPTHLRSALAEIASLAKRKPPARVIITSRFPRVLRRLGLPSMQIASFDDRQVKSYLDRAFEDPEAADRFFVELQAIPRLAELCRNPLLLHMLVDISTEALRVPPNRGRLLHEFMTRFLEREREAMAPTEPLTMQLVLADLAFKMRKARAVSLSELEVQTAIEQKLADVQHGAGVVDVLQALKEAKLLHSVGGGKLVFFHELVQEYYAAYELQRIYRRKGQLPEGIVEDEWWRQVLVLFAGLVDEAQVFEFLNTRDVAISADVAVDAPVPDRTKEDAVVARAAEMLDSGERVARAYEALATIWTDQARNVLAKSLDSKQKIRDFISRFGDNPYRAAVDLLETNPIKPVVLGIGVPLKTGFPATEEPDRERLGVMLCDLLRGKNAGEHPDLEYSNLTRLAPYAIIPEGERVKAAEILRETVAKGGVAEALGAAHTWRLGGTSLRFEKEVYAASFGKAVHGLAEFLSSLEWPVSDRRQAVAKALLHNRFDLLNPLCRPEDREWLRPFLPAVGKRLLETRGSAESVYSSLVELAGKDEAAEVLEALANSGDVPLKHLPRMAELIGKPTLLEEIGLAAIEESLSEGRSLAYIPRILDALNAPLGEELARRIASAAEKAELIGVAAVAFSRAGLDKECGLICEKIYAAVLGGEFSLESPEWSEVLFGSLWQHWNDEQRARLVEDASSSKVLRQSIGSWREEARVELRRRVEADWDFSLKERSFATLEALGLLEQAVSRAKERTKELIAQRQSRDLAAVVLRWNLLPADLDLGEPEFLTAKSLLQKRAEELIQTGAETQALTLVAGWDLDRSAPPLQCLDVANGASSTGVVVHGLRTGAVTVQEAEAWLLHQIQAGNISEALGLLASGKRAEFQDVATVAVLDLMEQGSLLEAGQVITAFQLHDDFAPELERVIPTLLKRGKVGVATDLAKTLGADFAPRFGRLVVESASRSADAGDFRRAVSMVANAGFSFLSQEFGEMINERARHYAESGQLELAEALVRDPEVATYLDAQLVREMLFRKHLAVPATVKRIFEEKQFGFVTLPSGLGDAFLHRSVAPQVFDTLAASDAVVVKVAQGDKGAKVVNLELAHRKDDEDHPAAQATPKLEARSAEQDPPGRDDREEFDVALALLRRRWGA